MKYDFDTMIDRTNTYCTQWDYVQDRFGVPGLLPFTISDMDFAVSPEIFEAVNKRIQHPIYGYSRWRNEEYLSSICGWYKKRFSCNIEKEWIYYSPSVMYSVAKMIQMLSKPNDGVTMLVPAYDAFFHVIGNNKRKLIRCEMKETNKGYEIPFDELKNCLKQSKIFLLCNPHNPVGRLWKKEELETIAQLCEETGNAVISDDIHMDLVFRSTFTPFMGFNKNITSVICSSPSKAFNTPSLGGSYIIIQDKQLGDQFEKMTRYTEYVNSPAVLGVISTIAAYQSEGWLEALLNYIQGNIDYSLNYIKENMPDWEIIPPEGCYFLWISFEKMHITDEEMQNALVHIGKVAVMAGTMYEGKNHLRFHVGCPRSKVEEGLKRMKLAYDWIKENGNNEV